MKIGELELDQPLILAPMAGVTDLPFRLLCKRMGADLLCMEMVSAKAIHYRNRNTEALMRITEEERPVSLQLFGSEPELMAEVARSSEERPIDILDINMGCPVPKVVNNGEGSALMKDPLKAGKIIESVVRSINKPVTVKIRKGFDDSCVNAVEMARIAEQSGAAAITVHGRTREQYYSGKADWDIITQVKNAVKIPVIGNGDVTDGESAVRLIEETGCDGVAVGRAARGNPFIFREIRHYLDTGEICKRPERQELLETILMHASLQLEYKGEYTGVREMRKHIGWYSAGMPGGSKLRNLVNSMETMDDIENVVKRAFG